MSRTFIVPRGFARRLRAARPFRLAVPLGLALWVGTGFPPGPAIRSVAVIQPVPGMEPRSTIQPVPLMQLGVPAAWAAPVGVRLPEGNTRGFLVVRAADGETIGYGEWRQKPGGGVIESRFALSFKDGSRREETVVYSQGKAFRVESYRLLQRGPSFPTSEISFDRKSGRYTARTQEKKDSEEQTSAGTLEMPADLYNGMDLVLLKNLADGESASGQLAVFTPKPRLIKMTLLPELEEKVRLGGQQLNVRRYLVKLEVGGLTGVIASVIGKEPPDLRYWLVTGEVPAFLRFEGAMFLNGPTWRVEMTTLESPR